MSISDLLAKLIEAGTPAALVAEVATALAEANAITSRVERLRLAKQEGNRARQQAFRERNASNALSRSVTPVTRYGRYADKEETAPAPALVFGLDINIPPSETTSLRPPQENPPEKKSRKKSRTGLADGAQPDDKDRQIAEDAGLSREEFRLEWQKFRAHHVATGSQMADWHAAWRKWTLNVRPLARAGPARTEARPRNNGYAIAREAELNEQLTRQNQDESRRSNQSPFADVDFFGHRSPPSDDSDPPGWGGNVVDLSPLSTDGSYAKRFG